MAKEDFKWLADLIVDINMSFPWSGEIVDAVEQKIMNKLKKEPAFDYLKWKRYISNQISKKMVENKLKHGEVCGKCLGKGHFDQSHDGFGRVLTCDECGGTGNEREE